MSKTIYALLVGINDYPTHVGKLQGCRNDVQNLNDYLDQTCGDNVNVIRLLDSDATRANVIREFRDHLGRATADDVVLFQYSGHGAQWKSAPDFAKYSPGGWDEGLVLCDSRDGANFDLADKELAVLLSELHQNGPHISVVLDCCHSGSATRGADDFVQAKPRQTHTVHDPRPLDSYLDGYYSQRLKKDEGIYLPVSRHILLAACDRKQKAWEGKDHQGVFTQSLLEVLAKPDANLSYANLFLRCREAVRNRATDQDPQFETYAGFRAYSGFLGMNADGTTGRCTVIFDEKSGQWNLNRGAIHGLPTAVDKSTEMEIYAEGDSTTSLGTAWTTQVGAQLSPLEFNGFEPVTDSHYEAELSGMPVAPMPVALIAADSVASEIRSMLAGHADQICEFALIPEGHSTKYTLRVEDDVWKVELRETGRLLLGARGEQSQASQHIFDALNKMAYWERTLKLQNDNSKLNPDDVDFHLVDAPKDDSELRIDSSDFTFDVKQKGDMFRGKLKARNTCGQELHFTLMYMGEDYSVAVPYNSAIDPTDDYFEFVFPAGEGQESPYIFAGLEDGEKESQFFLKLLVSTERVDDFLLPREGIDGFGKVREFRGTRGGMSFGEPPRRKITHRNEWFTKTIAIRVIRQEDRVRGDQDVSLAGGQIKIRANSNLNAAVSLTSAKTGHRSAGSPTGFYQALEKSQVSLVNFSSTRGDDDSVLELSNIEADESQLRDHPLEIELDVELLEDEFILPLAFDGEHILLTGNPSRDDDGRTHVSIDHIPEIPDNRRSLGKALKLYFFKTYLGRRSVNRLCWVEYKADGSVERHEDGVAEKVAAAKNILLLIHGIIGDTQGIAEGLPNAIDADGAGLNEKFDLVLTYDYENLSTPIEITAAQLKQQLNDAGLHEKDDKRLTLLVHSMGGLVSRWFIERESGHQVVDHLVMCGTPNVGSPFGEIDGARSVSSILATLGINTFPAFAPFGAAVLYALNRSKKLTGCLEQMNPASAFITTLNASDDPGVHYTIVAGDTREYAEASNELAATLIAKLGSGFLFDKLYAEAAHDIAVAVDSIRGVPDNRDPAPLKQTIIGHHLNYFLNPASLETLATIDW